MAAPVQPSPYERGAMILVGIAWTLWAYYIMTGEGLAFLASTFCLLLLSWCL